MSKYRNSLPWGEASLFLCYVGLETDLMFNQGFELPGFASYPLLNDEKGRAALWNSYRDQIALAREYGTGLQLDSATWMANRDRAAVIDVSPEEVLQANRDALAILSEARDAFGDCPTILSANVGTRSDAYAPAERMSVEEAEEYHAEQISVIAETEADIVTAMTLSYPEEAAGIVRACRRYGLPVVVSFTVETDGHLPTGGSLPDAIAFVDEATEGYAEHFLINCAHPEHFADILEEGSDWMQRVRGVIANASRCSHAELDEAEELDDGNPVELGQQLNALRNRFPQFLTMGGCCGTDLRHMAQIAKKA